MLEESGLVESSGDRSSLLPPNTESMTNVGINFSVSHSQV